MKMILASAESLGLSTTSFARPAILKAAGCCPDVDLMKNVSVQKAADMLSKSKSTILRMIKAGEIPSTKLEGHSGFLISYEWLKEYMEKNTVPEKPDDRLLTPMQAANLVHVSRSCIYNWLHSTENPLKALKIADGVWRIEKEELISYFAGITGMRTEEARKIISRHSGKGSSDTHSKEQAANE